MSSCPYCGQSASGLPGDFGTCGDFPCLHHRFLGAAPPAPLRGLRSLPWSDPCEVRRIAVLRPGQLGDTLLATPALRALKDAFPMAEVTIIARSWAVELARRYPCVDRAIPLTAPLEDWNGVEGLAHPFLAEAMGYGYDLVLQLHGDSTTAARLALAMQGRLTAGFCREQGIGAGFDLLLPMPEGEPEILRGLRLVHSLGARPAGAHLEFPLLPDDRRELEAIPELAGVLEQRPVVLLHPGARPPAKRWPVERFAELADTLHRRWNATLVVVGGAEEPALVEVMLERAAAPAANLAGRLSLGGLAALLSRADLFVGNDSGPAQLAAALCPRSLRIFGPANRHRWAPLDRDSHRIVHHQVECSPCGHWECPIDHRCLRRVGLDDVLAEADRLLGETVTAPQQALV